MYSPTLIGFTFKMKDSPFLTYDISNPQTQIATADTHTQVITSHNITQKQYVQNQLNLPPPDKHYPSNLSYLRYQSTILVHKKASIVPYHHHSRYVLILPIGKYHELREYRLGGWVWRIGMW